MIKTFISTIPPYRWHARLLGELCPCDGRTVEWSLSWSGTKSPHSSTSGPDLFVYQRDDGLNEPGILTATALIKEAGVTVYVSDPVYLVITSDTYYSYA